MLHLRVHGKGEVIRVLLVSLEFGRPNLSSFLQVPRERERENRSTQKQKHKEEPQSA